MYIRPVVNSTVNNYQLKRASAFNNTFNLSFKGEVDSFDYEARLKVKLDGRSKWQKFWGTGKKKAKNDVNSELIGFNLNREMIEKKSEQLIKEKEEQLKQKEETIKLMEEKNELLKERYKEALKNKEKDEIIVELKKEIEQLQQRTKAEKQEYNEEVNKINTLRQEQEIITGREAGKGWNKIAGHAMLKSQLEEVFINKIPLEKAGYEVNMPNGILLYGQHGTGKTRFAQAFAEQANCNFIKIDTMQENDEIINDLRFALRKAKKIYNSTASPKKRTIILLDDFNAIAKLSKKEKEDLDSKNYSFEDTSVGQLVELLQDCSSKYKATVFMTTNHPKKIDSELLKDSLVPYQIFLGPPNPNDSAEIFKYHTEGFTEQDIDYNKLGYKVSKAIMDDEAYSAQGIVNVVEYAKQKAKGAQVTQADLLDAIDKVNPDITSEEFDAFLDDMEYLLESTSKVNERKN